jgi:hypothetical protein
VPESFTLRELQRLCEARNRMRGRREGPVPVRQSFRFQWLWNSFQASRKPMEVLPVPVGKARRQLRGMSLGLSHALGVRPAPRSSQHLAGALFTHMAGLNMTHVPYKGGAPALLDLVGGDVKTMIVQPTSRERITSGQLRALAVSSATRSRHCPDVPTVGEAGVPGYQAVAWCGVVGPRNMPPGILKKITDEVVRAIGTEPVRRVIDAQGGDMVAGTPVAFADFVAAERRRYETIVRTAGISVE